MIQKQDRHFAIASFLALMLYFGPNLFQDIHRVFGHSIDFHYIPSDAATQVYSYSTQCPVCVFEFTAVDELTQYNEKTVVNEWFSNLTSAIGFPELKATNFNFRSRAPPM